jgi:hypothetical protein
MLDVFIKSSQAKFQEFDRHEITNNRLAPAVPALQRRRSAAEAARTAQRAEAIPVSIYD